jgi:oligopeptide/dipeptide ABC transporter ATP-binding protein
MSVLGLDSSSRPIVEFAANGRVGRNPAAALTASGLTIQVRRDGDWKTVVHGVSLSLRQGSVEALVGETGSGKTLTALSLIGLLPASARLASGRISVLGEEIDNRSERGWQDIRGRRISMIAQDPLAALNPVRTVGFQLAEPLVANLGMSKRRAALKAAELLEQVGIANPDRNLHRYPHELSGGMRQRVLIAMALACNPAVLLADEPTTAIDVTIQAQILQLLRELASQRGLAVLLVTHDLAVASQIADHVQVLYAGSIAEAGASAAVLRNPTHPYTQGLVGCVPRVDRRVTPMPTLPGSASGAWLIAQGCRFAPRCPFVQPHCLEEEPILESVGNDHSASCWVFAPGAGSRVAS